MSDDPMAFGPAMQALTEKQQKFVLAMLADPFGSQASWAKAAGYSVVKDGHRVRSTLLIYDPKVEAAVAEVSRSTMNLLGPILATQGLIRIARNPRHPKHHWALERLANRTGFHETTEHKVTVDHGGSAEDVAARIRKAALLLGVDPAVLLGQNAPAPMKLIEGVSRETEKIDDARTGN